MRTQILILLVSCLTQSFGQTNKFRGLVLDSISHRPIPFCTVHSADIGTTTADSIGNFEFLSIKDSVLKLKVITVGYFLKDIVTKSSKKDIVIYLAPFSSHPDLLFNIKNKQADTIFYSDKTPKKISFGHGDEITFYSSGQKQTTSINGHVRSWYINGQMEYQSIQITNHWRQESAWYDNGQLKSQGTLNWRDNYKTNAGDWFKKNDWKYWNKDGTINVDGQ
jgi:hypothetical protein